MQNRPELNACEVASGAAPNMQGDASPGGSSLVERLQHWAVQRPDAVAFTFLRSDGSEKAVLTFAELSRRAQYLAEQLSERAEPGERVVMAFHSEREFIEGFFSCLLAGVIAVPASPPAYKSGLDRLLAIIRGAQAKLIFTDDENRAALTAALEEQGEPLPVFSAASLEPAPSRRFELPLPDTTAMLQFTSGSTAVPRGVVLTHAHLLRNEALITQAFGYDERTVFAGVLPLFHDMGLIGNVLQPVYLGIPCVLISPSSFLKRPACWLNAISRYGVTTSGGPNFLYQFAVDRIRDDEIAGIDLSRWSVAFNGAEPIRSATLDRFCARFARFGFSRAAFAPCYGLAEATLLVSGGPPGRDRLVRAVDREALQEDRIKEPAGDAVELVCCGFPAEENTLRIVSRDGSRSLGSDTVGEIWIRAETIAGGYWQDTAATEQKFRARLPAADGVYLRTGDLGFLDPDGRLFVTGRLKDLIILNGQNIYPQDLEETASATDPCLGRAAAFQINSSPAKIVVLVEAAHQAASEWSAAAAAPLFKKIRRAIYERQGIAVDTVAMVASGSLPRTTSGKLRRSATAQSWQAGSLRVVAREEAFPVTANGHRHEFAAALAAALQIPEEQVADQLPLVASGTDSLGAATLSALLERQGFLCAPAVLLAAESLEELESAMTRVTEAPRAVGPAPSPGPIPLGEGQRSFWFAQLARPDSSVHNVSLAVRIGSPFEAVEWSMALNEVAARHEILSVRMGDAAEGPCQTVVSGRDFVTPVVDATEWPAGQIERWVEEFIFEPFDLFRGPLFRSAVLVTQPEERSSASPGSPARAAAGACAHVLVLAAHHAVVDLWSMARLFKEALDRYQDRRTGAAAALRPAPALASLIAQAAARSEHARAAAIAFWKEILGGDFEMLDLPLDRAPQAQASEAGARVYCTIDADRVASLFQFCAASSATPAMVLLAVFRTLLFRYTGQSDVLIGTPVSTRSYAEQEAIGCHINPVPIRCRMTGDSSFHEVVAEVRTSMLGAIQHAGLPLWEIMRHAPGQRSASQNSLYQTMFAFQQVPFLPEAAALIVGQDTTQISCSGVTLSAFPMSRVETPFDLALMIAEGTQSLRCAFDYRTEVLDRETVARFAAHFQNVLTSALAQPESPIARLPMLGRADLAELEVLQSGDVDGVPGAHCVHQLIRQQADRTPEAVAVRWQDESLTYAQLLSEARTLAAALKRRGIGREDRIGICMRPSADWVICLLAGWEAGATLVPLDGDMPSDRLRDMLEETGAGTIVCDAPLSPRLREVFRERAVTQESLRQPCPAPYDDSSAAAGAEADPRLLAYIAFTSGSAGRPKGVMITHQGASNFALGQIRRLERRALRRVLQLTPPSFDAAFSDVFMSLMTGGTLCIAPSDARVPGRELKGFLKTNRITLLTATPSMLAELQPEDAPDLQAVIAMGEASNEQSARRWSRVCAFYNGYGPTEASIGCTLGRFAPEAWTGPLSIGKPFANYQVYLLDANLNRVPIGVPGELFIGGPGLARGYVNHADWTAERFLPDPFAAPKEGTPGQRMYRTGDRARWRQDGRLEFLGRLDRQVKLRGVRIEPGEIELVLREHPAVRDCYVEIAPDIGSGPRLIAYLVGPSPADTGVIAAWLRSRFPVFMIPSQFVCLPSIPRRSHGKLDRAQLPAVMAIPETGATGGPLEAALSTAWSEVLGVSVSAPDSNFFDLGGHSLLLPRLQLAVERHAGRSVGILDFFQYPTIRDLAAYLSGGEPSASQASVPRRTEEHGCATQEPVAIIGMAGQFPDAGDVETFWQNLLAGRESITFFSPEELTAAGVRATDSSFVPARGVLSGVELFDAAFFGFSPREAEILDPQKRILLELAQKALDDAGYAPSSKAMENQAGVFVGTSRNTYLANNVAHHPDILASLGSMKIGIGNDPGFTASLLGYRLNLSGPCINIDTACSTSLVAVHQACQSLRAGECTIALAGGASIDVPLAGGHHYAEGLIASPDGHCRPFDHRAAGTVKGMGAGLVVLKLLRHALRDRDHIYAVVRGSAVNNDGNRKIGFTAPSIDGQALVIQRALQASGVDASSLGYVQAHGTGTTLGDPIEISALHRALDGARPQSILIGSVKANIGHLDAAAGIAGLIATVLVVSRGIIPPQLHLEQPNPKIDWDRSPLRIATEMREFETGDGPRRAGVSSFGIGGTNAHVIVEEPPVLDRPENSGGTCVIALSSGTPESLRRMAAELAEALVDRPYAIEDVSYTLSAGRRQFKHRMSLVSESTASLAHQLAGGQWQPVEAISPRPPVVFAFLGEECAMDTRAVGDLFTSLPALAAAFDRCCATAPHDVREQLAALAAGTLPGSALSPSLLYPAIFALEYAFGDFLSGVGVEPDAVTGQGVGELTACCIAGCLPVGEGMELACTWGALAEACAPGAMIAVKGAPDPGAASQVFVAATLGPNDAVLAGPAAAISRQQDLLRRSSRSVSQLTPTRAYYSPLMTAVCEPLQKRCAGYNFAKPKIPIYSAATGQRLHCVEPAHWAGIPAREQSIGSALRAATADFQRSILLDMGASPLLLSCLRRSPDVDFLRAFSLITPADPSKAYAHLLETLGHVWELGVSVTLAATVPPQARRVPLPGVCFERTRHWLDAPQAPLTVIASDPSPAELAPSTAHQEMVAALWRKFLGVTSIAEDDDFFAVGGDSLLAIEFATELGQALGVKISPQVLFQYPSFALLCNYVASTAADGSNPVFSDPSPAEPAPSTAHKEMVTALWRKFLGVTSIAEDDDFFAVGGDSLLAIEFATELGQALGVKVSPQVLFQYPSFALLCNYVASTATDGSNLVASDPSSTLAPGGPLPLSTQQRDLLLATYFEHAEASLNLTVALRFQGELDVSRLGSAFRALLAHHPVLLNNFDVVLEAETEGIQWQAHHPSTFAFEVQTAASSAWQTAMRKEAVRGFSVTSDLLVRGLLLVDEAGQHCLVVTVHHLVADGASLLLMLRDLASFYANPQSQLPPVPSYAEYVAAQCGAVVQSAHPESEAGSVPRLALTELPGDKFSSARDESGDTRSVLLSPELTASIRSACQQQNATLFNYLLAAFHILVARFSGTDEVAIASPIVVRSFKGYRDTVGPFASLAIFQNSVHGGDTFSQVLAAVRENIASTVAAGGSGMSANASRPELDPGSRSESMFRVAFALNYPLPASVPFGADLSAEPLMLPRQRVRHRLMLWIDDLGADIKCTLEYRTAVYSAALIQRYLEAFVAILRAVSTDSARQVGQISVLSPEDQRTIDEANATTTARPAWSFIHHEIARMARQRSHAPAFFCEGRTMNYGTMDREARRIARLLLEDGLRPDEPVGVALERGIDFVVAMLGVLYAGGCYLPLDRDLPAVRIQQMLDTSGARRVIVGGRSPRPGNVRCVEFGAQPDPLRPEPQLPVPLLPQNLAYVLFTSGSTGTPKGVMVDHRALANRLDWMMEAFAIQETDRILHKTPAGFDVSVWELFLPLLAGAAMVIAKPGGHRDPTYLAELMFRERVTTVHFVPSMLQAFLDQPPQPMRFLRWLIVSGEALHNDLYERASAWLGDRGKTVNLYGPTEAAIDVTAWRNVEAQPGVAVTIGRPIQNVRIQILDRYLQPLPIGIVGDLCISGVCLARGYMHAPHLTAERFLPDPSVSGGAMFFTGDRARWNAQGEIEFCGRADRQVKLRGMRIELEEIESVLRTHPSVADVVTTIVGADDEAKIVAHVALNRVLANSTSLSMEADLTAYLEARLPSAMVPSEIRIIEKLPITPNGKLDRIALHSAAASLRGSPSAARLSPAIGDIWARLLGQQPGAQTDFFRVGGNSLLAIRLVAAIRRELGCKLSVESLLRHSTFAGLCSEVERLEQQDEAPAAIEAHDREKFQPFPMTEVQRAYAVGRSSAFQLGNISTQGYLEIHAHDIDPKRFGIALNKLIRRHDMLRTIMCGEGMMQLLPTVPPYVCPCLDLTSCPQEEAEKAIEAIRAEMSEIAFSLEQWPLFDVRLTRISADRHVVHIAMDAIILDGASAVLLERDLNLLYTQPLDAEVETPRLSYRDYALWRAAERSSDRFRQVRSYWMDRLESLPSGPQLPLRVPLGSIQVPRFQRLHSLIEESIWRKLEQRGHERGLTPASIVVAVYGEVLVKWSGQEHFALNLPVSNRPPLHADLQQMVGNFTATLLLEVDRRDVSGFTDFVSRIHRQLWMDLGHIDFDGVELQRMRARRQKSFAEARTPIVFTGLFGLPHEMRDTAERIFDLSRESAGISRTSQVLLDCIAIDRPEGLLLNWDYVEQAFPTQMIDEMFAAFVARLHGLARDEGAWGGDLVTQQPTWRAPRIEVSSSGDEEQTLLGLVLDAADAHANRLAVIAGEVQLTYGGLLEQAKRVAAELASLGMQSGEVVAVAMEKGWEQVVAVLGVMLAGGVYVPVEANLPAARQQQIFEESGTRYCVTQPALAANIEASALAVATVPAQASRPRREAKPPGCHDLAYIIFTSGSTGRPKGVAIEHGAAANTVIDMNRRFRVTPDDCVLCVSGLGFDLSVYDIFGLLAAGGRLVFPEPGRHLDADHWWQLIHRHKVTLWNTTPLLAEHLLNRSPSEPFAASPSLRLFLLSGDWIALDLPDRIRRMLPATEVVSLGGATEASIWSIFYPVTAIDPLWRSIPYGRPLTGQDVVVLDKSLEHCPNWVIGDILIAGHGVAREYWKRPELTAEAFIHHPVWDWRLYRTGDLGRYLPDGNIEFIGRNDNQIKLHGVRLELGEVESALESHPGVERAVVLAEKREGREVQRLVPYIQLSENALASGAACEIRRDAAALSQAWTDLLAANAAVGNDEERVMSAEEFASLIQGLEDKYRAALRELFTTFPQFRAPGNLVSADELLQSQEIAPRYRKWLARALSYLAAAGVILPAGEGKYQTHPGTELDLLAAGQEADVSLAPILREQLHSAQIYAGSATAASYQTYFQGCHRVAAALLQQLVRDARTASLHLLEIGAGYGSLTQHLLPLLRDHDQYVFTDISGFFLQEAEQRFSNYPFLTFAQYDMDVDPQLQNHALHHYDVVVAASVLHNARNLSSTLGKLKSALAPGGILLLIEETSFFPFFDLGMGLQQGFDDFEDDLRQAHPLLSREQWQRALAQAGFPRTAVLHQEGTVEDRIGFDVIMAQASESATVLNTTEMAGYLSRLLPKGAVPSEWIQIDAFPRTSSGKVDRRGLALPQNRRDTSQQSYCAPRNEVEQTLAEIWAAAMALPRVSIQDDFFEIGGDSLVASRVVSEMRRRFGLDIPIAAIFQTTTIEGLAALVSNRFAMATPTTSPSSPIKAPPAAVVLCSYAQERFLFNAGLAGSSNPYRLDAGFRIRGQLDLAALEQSLRDIVRRHEILRARFEPTGNGFLLITTDWEPKLEVVDCECSEEDLIASLGELPRPEFDLLQGPHVSTTLYRFSPDSHLLLVSIHHLVSDGGSIAIFTRELQQGYAQHTGLLRPSLPSAQLQFRDLAYYERGSIEDVNGQLAFWKEDLESAPALLSLTTDFPRPRVPGGNAGTIPLLIPAAVYNRMKEVRAKSHLSDFQIVVAAFWLMLRTYSGQEAIVIGTPWRNRERPGADQVIGPLLNLLALHIRPFSGATIADLLKEVNTRTLAAIRHGTVPFEQVVSHVSPVRSTAYTPIFQVMCAIEPTPMEALRLGGLTIEPVDLPGQHARYDLALVLQQAGEGLRGSLKWDRALFRQETAEAMAAHLLTALDLILNQPELPLQRVQLMSAQEQQQVLQEWNRTDRDYPLTKTLVDLFEAQVVAAPDSLAVEDLTRGLTYRELNAWANRIARCLVEQGVGADDVVGLVMDRSVELVAAVLGILKAGACYLAIDTQQPAERRSLMLARARVKAVIGEPCLDVREICISALEQGEDTFAAPRRKSHPLGACYLIFTSGSTGEPKGVVVEHQAIANNLLWMNDEWPLSESDAVLFKSSPGFDVSVKEIFWPLIAGARLIVAPPGVAGDPKRLGLILQEKQISVVHMVPTMLDYFLQHVEPSTVPHLRIVMCGGEALSPSLRDRFHQTFDALLLHLYGPTEAAIAVTGYAITRDHASVERLPLGRPMPNCRLYVLDNSQQPVPVGVPGELCISGIPLARGYYGHPELTAEKFLPDPFSPQPASRLYLTGDRARFKPDGQIEFLGRFDRQIKFGGLRIELGEIEATLRKLEGVQDALVLDREVEGRHCLVAYIASKSDQVTSGAVQQALKLLLPAPMIPSSVTVLPSFPANINGKVDIPALPSPGAAAIPLMSNPPQGELEEKIARIWQDILSVGAVDRDVSFFDVGGHSLLILQVQSNLRDQLGASVSIANLFANDTIAGLATFLSSSRLWRANRWMKEVFGTGKSSAS